MSHISRLLKGFGRSGTPFFPSQRTCKGLAEGIDDDGSACNHQPFWIPLAFDRMTLREVLLQSFQSALKLIGKDYCH